jgi:hypothetical protein
MFVCQLQRGTAMFQPYQCSLTEADCYSRLTHAATPSGGYPLQHDQKETVNWWNSAPLRHREFSGCARLATSKPPHYRLEALVEKLTSGRCVRQG